MSEPIYSNHCGDQEDLVKKEHHIPLLRAERVDEINQKLTFKEHGFFVFIQYTEQPYIVNGFAETVFWETVNALYKLLHDSGNEQFDLFLGTGNKNGMQALRPFGEISTEDRKKLEQLDEFRKRVNDLRLYHCHNMKPDSPEDQARKDRVEEWLKKYSRASDADLKEQEWEGCITYLYKKSVELEQILDKRLLFLETKAEQLQQTGLCSLYYKALKEYYLRNMFEIIKNYVKKVRIQHHGFKVTNGMISAWTNQSGGHIAKTAVELIQNTKKRADPYKAVLEAADTVFKEKSYWGD